MESLDWGVCAVPEGKTQPEAQMQGDVSTTWRLLHDITGRDGVVRAVRLRAEKSYLEQAIQYLYPMDLSCDQQLEEQAGGRAAVQLNPGAREFRPTRRAAVVSAENIRRITDTEAAELSDH